jgi:hypothetical protein
LRGEPETLGVMPKEETRCTLIRYSIRSLACIRRIRIRMRTRKRMSKRMRMRIRKRVIGYRSHVVESRYLYIETVSELQKRKRLS